MSTRNSPVAADYHIQDNNDAKPVCLKWMVIRSLLFRELLAEFAGIFVFLTFALGVCAQKNVSNNGAGDWTSLGITWGIGLALGVYVAGGVSGAHLNPAISFTFALFGKLSWIKLPFYMLAQFLGAFCAATVVYMCYHTNIVVNKDSAGIFATYPAPKVTNGAAFLNEIVATALLVGPIFAICDTRNIGASYGIKPLAIGAVIAAVAMAFGYNTAFALNPARDFGPRLLTSLAAWGSDVWSWNDHYFWVPLIAPFIGAPLGALLYTFFVQLHHPAPVIASREHNANPSVV